MAYGWVGKILRVDLATKKATEQALPQSWMKELMGCRGFATKIMWDEVGPEVDPFSPDNKLIFSTGPLDGTPMGMGRVSIQTKHAMRFLGEGGAGGYWSPELKFAGYDVLVIEQKADKPVYILIEDDHVEIRDASHLWGKDNKETNILLQQELGSHFQICSIGPASERLVANTKIFFHGTYCGGRGTGEIMGHKKLKAIAVRGTGSVQVKDPDGYLKAYRRMLRAVDIGQSRDPNVMPSAIFAANFMAKNVFEMGSSHAYNAQRARPINVLSEMELIENFTTKPSTSFCCPFPGCGRRFEIKTGKYAGTSGAEREGGHQAALHITGVNSWEAVLKMRDMCNRSGLDEFMICYVIGWAMELYQRRIITKEDTDGLALNFGDEEVFIKLIQKVIDRDGFGDILANGAQKAAEIIGRGSERYLLTLKGRELDTMPQRNTLQIALALAVCEGGADHTRWYPPYPSNPKAIPQGIKTPYDPRAPFESLSPEGKGAFVKFLYDKGALIENMPTCILMNREAALVDNSFWKDLYVATTGHEVTEEEFLQIGERCINLERAYIAREGFRRQDDRPPRRMMEEPLPEAGTPAIGQENMDKMLDDYYSLRGWDPATGIPTAKKLRELQLDYVIDDLSRLE